MDAHIDAHFEVTDRALTRLAAYLGRIDTEPGQLLVLTKEEGRAIGVELAQADPDDRVFAQDGTDVLAVPPALNDILSGYIFDYVDQPEGGRFDLSHP